MATKKKTQPQPKAAKQGNTFADKFNQLMNSGAYDLKPRPAGGGDSPEVADYKNTRSFDQQQGLARLQAENQMQKDASQFAAGNQERIMRESYNLRQREAQNNRLPSFNPRETISFSSTVAPGPTGRGMAAGIGAGGMGGGGNGGAGGGGIASPQDAAAAALAARERMFNADLAAKERMAGAGLQGNRDLQGDRLAAQERMQSQELQYKREAPGIQAQSEDELRRKAATRALTAFNALKPSVNKTVEANYNVP